MKIHYAKTRPAPFGKGTLTSSLCGKLNAGSRDGMNITPDRAEVTCSYCLKRLEAMDRREALKLEQAS